MELVLASTSTYRRALLQRLHIPFRCEAPEVVETPLPGEAPQALAGRLALAKAREVAGRFPDALVIGSDQVASIDGECIGKPGSHRAAAAQLAASSGRQLHFYTGLAVIRRAAAFEESLVERFSVQIRTLNAGEIEAYLLREQPYDCAGSFKWEGLGIALFQRMIGDDPTALERLPLIATCRLLRHAGLDVLGSPR